MARVMMALNIPYVISLVPRIARPGKLGVIRCGMVRLGGISHDLIWPPGEISDTCHSERREIRLSWHHWRDEEKSKVAVLTFDNVGRLHEYSWTIKVPFETAQQTIRKWYLLNGWADLLVTKISESLSKTASDAIQLSPKYYIAAQLAPKRSPFRS